MFSVISISFFIETVKQKISLFIYGQKLFIIPFIRTFTCKTYFFTTKFQMIRRSSTQKRILIKQSSVDILFKGLKRQIDHQSYSKIKNSYKKKPIQNHQYQTTQSLIPGSTNRTKLKLSMVTNKNTDPQVAHDELIKMKETNHKLFEENNQLLRKIRKQEKIEEIYRKKLQGKQLIQLQYFKILEIKLLLQVEKLENFLQDKQKIYLDKVQAIRAKKHHFKDEVFDKRVEVYEYMIESPQDLKRTLKEKKMALTKNEEILDILKEKLSKVKSKKNEQNEILNSINNEIKELKQKFKVEEAQTKKDQTNAQMLNITTLMSTIITGTQNSQLTKQASAAILKNNMSSMSNKNKSSIEQIEKEIQKIRQQYDSLNNEIQQFMNEKIKQKLLINKEIYAMQQVYKSEREFENRMLIYENTSLAKQETSTKNSRVSRISKTSMKGSLVVSS